VKENPEKRYNVISTTAMISKMTVSWFNQGFSVPAVFRNRFCLIPIGMGVIFDEQIWLEKLNSYRYRICYRQLELCSYFSNYRVCSLNRVVDPD
jgi:hypothetical protein